MSTKKLLLLASLLTLTTAQTCPCTNEIQEKINALSDKMEQHIESLSSKIEGINRPGTFASNPASSCEEILQKNSDSPSTHYWLRASNGTAVKMFCEMSPTCGGRTGGWMRVAGLDMTENPRCPQPLQYLHRNGKRVCRSLLSSGGCASVQYETHGMSYQKVCGKVIGYQQSTTDGAYASRYGSNINQPYIDGVVLSYGYPRQHIWSFVSALHEASDPRHARYTCYCANRYYPGPSPPSFVGQDYFCDTGCEQTGKHCERNLLTDALWDGAGCGPNNECCTFHNPPWFYKEVGVTRDNIEMRVCLDEPNEYVYVEKVYIYVQ